MAPQPLAIAVFKTRRVKGEAVAHATRRGMRLRVRFSHLPKGLHGFHIHKAGDLRGEGCAGACEHYHVGRPCRHGGPPTRGGGKAVHRHTGDLGNIRGPRYSRTYTLRGVQPRDLWGRTLLVHADPEDLGRGPHPESAITGHSGKRIACAVFGRGCGTSPR